MKLFNKHHNAKKLYLGVGKIIKIHDELSDVVIPNTNDFNLKPSQYIGVTFTCLKSYDNTVIFVPQKVFKDKGYDIFGKYTAIDPEDDKYIINISQFIFEYKTYCDTICKSSQTVTPTYIDIYKAYTCNKDNTIICIGVTDHISKTDSIYTDLSQLRQIKERLHI